MPRLPLPNDLTCNPLATDLFWFAHNSISIDLVGGPSAGQTHTCGLTYAVIASGGVCRLTEHARVRVHINKQLAGREITSWSASDLAHAIREQ